MDLKLAPVDTISVYPSGGGWKTSVTREIVEKLGVKPPPVSQRKPFNIVVCSIEGIDGLLLLVAENKIPRRKEFLEKALQASITGDAFAFSLPKQLVKKIGRSQPTKKAWPKA